jgi:hypothetical protein
MIDSNGCGLYTCHGPCHVGLLLLTSKSERDHNVTGSLGPLFEPMNKDKLNPLKEMHINH